MKSEDCFVFIAGGGPVGLTLALDLGTRGVPTILASENVETARHPKCNYLNTRSMEHFRRLELVEEVRRNGISGVSKAVAFRTRFCGYELGRIELTFLAHDNWPGPEYPQHISQIALEPILKDRAENMPGVDVRFGWRVVDLVRGQAGSAVTIQHVESGERRRINARYVVGCDGSRSFVRGALDVGMKGDDGSAVRHFVSGTMLAYFFEAKTLHDRCGHSPAQMTWIVNHDARGYIMSQNGRDRFVAHFQVPADVDWRELKSDDVLRRMLGEGIEYTMITEGPWTGGLALVADRMGVDDVFLAGDAAHLYTPLGGFGLNTGIGDALNLSWKLAAVHEGWGGPELLSSYDAERRPIAERNSQIGIKCAARKDHWELPSDLNEATPDAEARRRKLGAHIEVDDREEYATIGIQLGERYLSPIIASNPGEAPLADPWDHYVPTDAPGARTPHFTLEDGQSLYDVLGEGFGLIAFADVDTARLEAAAVERGVPLVVVRPVAMPEGYTRRLVLVRPDRHVAWSADELPADCGKLVDRVRGAAP